MSDDLLSVDMISIGNYTQKGDTIYFNDKFTFYKFEAVLKNDELTFLSGFPFMMGQKFNCFEKSTTYELNESHYGKHKSMLSESSDSAAFGQPHYPLEFRSYTAQGAYFPMSTIQINEDETYSLECGGLLFSEGKWERIGNLIRLKDSNFNHNHYVLIKENELVMFSIDVSCFMLSYR